jgi:RNA polymerase sigma-70 factor (ECF subfamily)
LDLQAFDATYLQRLRSGDPETERNFVSYFGELIRIKLRARLRSKHLVEDVRQETFLRVFRAVRSPEGIREPERLGAFVNSVCNNVLLEVFRSQGRHPTPAEEPEPARDETSPDPESSLLTEERKKQVRHVIEALPAKDRRLLHALFLEDRDKDEICAQLGVGRDYLRVLLHRAKLQFRSVYQQRHGGGEAVAVFEPGRRSLRSLER